MTRMQPVCLTPGAVPVQYLAHPALSHPQAPVASPEAARKRQARLTKDNASVKRQCQVSPGPVSSPLQTSFSLESSPGSSKADSDIVPLGDVVTIVPNDDLLRHKRNQPDPSFSPSKDHASGGKERPMAASDAKRHGDFAELAPRSLSCTETSVPDFDRTLAMGNEMPSQWLAADDPSGLSHENQDFFNDACLESIFDDFDPDALAFELLDP